MIANGAHTRGARVKSESHSFIVTDGITSNNSCRLSPLSNTCSSNALSEMRHEFHRWAGLCRWPVRVATTAGSALILPPTIGSQIKNRKTAEGFSPNMKVRAGIGGLICLS